MGYRCGVMMKKKWGRMNSEREREREWLPLNVDNKVNSLEILRKLKLINTKKKKMTEQLGYLLRSIYLQATAHTHPYPY